MKQPEPSQFDILFLEANLDIKTIAAFLKQEKFKVAEKNNELVVSKWDSPYFFIQYLIGHFQMTRIIEDKINKKKERKIYAFKARIQVRFDDLEEVLQEINTMIELQGSLEAHFKGLTYRHWNKVITE